MNACTLTALITATANTMAAELSDDELNVLALVFTQLGDTLATLATVRALSPNCNNTQEE